MADETASSPSQIGGEGSYDPPNVLVLTAHDLGRHLPVYGVDVQAPNVERLADEAPFR